jgi:hypothetical protein
LFYSRIAVFGEIFDGNHHWISAGGAQESYCRITQAGQNLRDNRMPRTAVLHDSDIISLLFCLTQGKVSTFTDSISRTK